MEIFIIWATDASGREKWAADAWDAGSVADFRAGFEQAIADVAAKFGEDRVRVVATTVNFGAVVNAFLNPADHDDRPRP